MSLTIVELVDRYIAWGRTYYVKPDGVTLTGENAMINTAIRPLLKLYARMPASKFRPRRLLTVRGAFVDSERYARKQVNDHVGRIKRLFAWGVEHELVPGRVPERLRSVRGLRRGKTTASDNPPVRAVSDATIALTMPWLPPVVRAMVQLQRLTGARPGARWLAHRYGLDSAENDANSARQAEKSCACRCARRSSATSTGCGCSSAKHGHVKLHTDLGHRVARRYRSAARCRRFRMAWLRLGPRVRPIVQPL